MFLALSSYSFEIILTFTTKVVTLYMQVFIIQIRVSGFKRPIQYVFLLLKICRSRILTVIYECLHKLSKQVILKWLSRGQSENISWNKDMRGRYQRPVALGRNFKRSIDKLIVSKVSRPEKTLLKTTTGMKVQKYLKS